LSRLSIFSTLKITAPASILLTSPDRTLPGPTSIKVLMPFDAIALNTIFPEHRLAQLAHKEDLISAAPEMNPASTLFTKAERHPLIRKSFNNPFEFPPGILHQCAMRRHAHCQRNRSLDARLSCFSEQGFNGYLFPGYNNLTRAV